MFPGTTPPIDCPLAWGTVGWDDRDTFYDLGTTQDDGNILVHVQLFRGRDMSKPLDQTVAQGQKLLCKVASNFLTIPPKGSRVLVAVPEPFGMVPGGSVIVLCDNPNPNAMGNIQPGEVCIWAPTGQARIILKDDGSITLYTLQGNTSTGAGIAVQLTSDGGINLRSPLGAISIASDAVRMMFGSSSAIQCDANGVTLIGNELSLNGASVLVGAQATALTPGAIYPLVAGVPPPSKSVFVSP